MGGNTGATALSVLGMTEICAVNDDLCAQYLDQ